MREDVKPASKEEADEAAAYDEYNREKSEEHARSHAIVQKLLPLAHAVKSGKPVVSYVDSAMRMADIVLEKT